MSHSKLLVRFITDWMIKLKYSYNSANSCYRSGGPAKAVEECSDAVTKEVQSSLRRWSGNAGRNGSACVAGWKAFCLPKPEAVTNCSCLSHIVHSANLDQFYGINVREVS